MKSGINSLLRAVFVLLLIGLSGTVASAAIINVNNVSDVLADDGACTLREAIIAANTNTASGAAVGECPAGEAGIADVINIPAGTYLLTIAPEDATPVVVNVTDWQVGEYLVSWKASAYEVSVPNPNAAVGDLDIMESISLSGAGRDLTIIDARWRPAAPIDITDPKNDPPDPDPSTFLGDRVLHVISNTDGAVVDVQITGLTLTGGKVAIVEGLVAPDTVSYNLRRNGGAVGMAVASGTYDPLSSGGGGGPPVIDPGPGEEGGATYSLTLTNVAMTSNYAGDGGGLYNAATSVATNVVISANRGAANGGGIYNDAPLTLLSSTVSGNSAEGGGGMFDTGSHTTAIAGSTLSGNGGVGGGGISSRAGVTIDVANSTVSSNFGFDVGGGIYTNGRVNLIHTTVADNLSNSDAPNGGSGINTFPSLNVNVTLRGVLLSNNLKGADPLTRVSANCGKTSGGQLNITSVGVGLGYNLSTDTSCLLAGIGDIQGAGLDAKLSPLADNGGPTQTQALQAGSPAINAAVPVVGLTTDQRGVARDGSPDIGAYEYSTAPPPPSGRSSNGDGGNCFIATAAYGTPMANEVRYLRALRDEYLLTNVVGQKFVAAYYETSPPIANFIRDREGLRAAVRQGLQPLVLFSHFLVGDEVVDVQR